MANTYLTRTFGTGDRRKFTLSFWMKKTSNSQTSTLFGASTDMLYLNSDKLQFEGAGGTLKTSRVFRDVSAFYHCVIAFDSAQATASDRIKFYVNGVQESVFDTSTYPTQNTETNNLNTGVAHVIGKRPTASDMYFDGLLSHFHFCDGYAYQASDFGSTDSVTGEWKINTSPSVTYGTNGFFILKDGNSVTDQSGNSNNFTVGGGTLTNTEDCPSNVFATLNPLYYAASQYTLSEGSNSITYATSSSRSAFGTIGMTDNLGKFYWEVKIVSDSSNKGAYGICDDLYVDLNQTGAFIDYSGGYGLFANGQSYNGGTGTSYGNAVTTGDIVGVAIDMDNRKLYFSKNGTWQNSGDPTSGASGTGAAYTVAAGKTYFPAVRVRDGTNFALNFGNGSFGSSAISSEGTNASGIGKFEYDVPTGYTALSTKGLNE
tara:strand:- start:317 stop:1606 length:1290 start_codon:yes stop_codon:yes gene_type:complete